MITKGFVNIQASVKEDFKAQFEDVFNSSGANSKGEFLRILLENYLSPDFESALKKVENEKNNEIEILENNCSDLNYQIQNLIKQKNDLLLKYNDLEKINNDLKNNSNSNIETVTNNCNNLQSEIVQLRKENKDLLLQNNDLAQLNNELTQTNVDLDIERNETTELLNNHLAKVEPVKIALKPIFDKTNGKELKFERKKILIDNEYQLLEIIVKSFNLY